MSDSEADEPHGKPGGKKGVDPSGFGSASGRAAARNEKPPKEPRQRRLRREKSPKPPPPEPGPPMLELRSRKRLPEPEPLDEAVETPPEPTPDSLVEPVETTPDASPESPVELVETTPEPTPGSLVEPVETSPEPTPVEVRAERASKPGESADDLEPEPVVEAPSYPAEVSRLVADDPHASTSEESDPDSLVEPVDTTGVEDLVSTSSTTDGVGEEVVADAPHTSTSEEVEAEPAPTPLMTDIPATSATTRRRSFAGAGAAVFLGGVVLALALSNGGWGTVSYLGAFVLAFGLILAVLSVPLLRQHRFLLSEVGVRWEQAGHDTWESPWHQILAVTLYLDADGPDQPPVQIGFRDLRSDVENTFAIESSALPTMRAALATYAPDLTVVTVHPHGH